MLTTTLRNVGGSVMFAIPKAILEGMGLLPNATVGLILDDGKLIIDPHPRQHYRLADLLAQCDPDAAPSPEDIGWQTEQPAGREEI